MMVSSSIQFPLEVKENLFPMKVLLVDDQLIVAEAIHRLLIDEKDIAFHYCNDPTKAISMATELHPTVILQDLVMPKIEGLVLVKYLRANPFTRDIPLIVLSSKVDAKVKAEAFALGANDYLVKIPQKEELIARVRYHSNSYIRLLERNLAYKKLEESQKILKAELNEAAGYVKSVLPAPLSNSIKTAWRFIPSSQLSGDVFGYHWIDTEHFAFYLLDVCGHGVGAALLSISVINSIRSHTLPATDFRDPAQVLTSLNKAFPMEDHNHMFFTLWYGVYDMKTSEIVYASGGHPPAVLLNKSKKKNCEWESCQLSTEGVVVGGVEKSLYESKHVSLNFPNQIYLFSDGVFEIKKKDGIMMSYGDFIKLLNPISSSLENELDHIVALVKEINGSSQFVDDFSILALSFTKQ